MTMAAPLPRARIAAAFAALRRLVPAFALAPLLLLTSCLIEPGEFVSTLDIRADRSFTFTYQGEVYVRDPNDSLSDSLKTAPDATDPDDGADSPADTGPTDKGVSYTPIALATNRADKKERAAPAFSDTPDEAADSDDREKRMAAVAEALRKEKGYRSVVYLGDSKFRIDYAIHGTLDHSFLFPYNIDARALFPFVVIELRGDDRVRVRAPSFGDGEEDPSMNGGKSGAKKRNGTFTLTTDAEIVSQNQEDGAIATPQGRKLVWTVTPMTTIAPMAVLKFPNRK